MKLKRLQVDSYKNLRDCDIEWSQPFVLNTVIGSNGSGKSNLIEAILHILIGVYFKKSPPFDFMFEYEAQQRHVRLQGKSGKLSVDVDENDIPLEHFAKQLHGGPIQVYYPELTFVYYSGECQRVRRLISRYERHFHKLTQNPDTDSYRPLFVHSGNQQANIILLALYAHRHEQFLGHLALRELDDITLVLQSPEGFDPERHEPKLWNAVGAVRRILAAIDDTATSQESQRQERARTEQAPDSLAYREKRIYRFRRDTRSGTGIHALAMRLANAGDNLYLALEHLRTRRIFSSVDYQLRGDRGSDSFKFDQLSEGEKQLLAVVGAIRLAHQNDNLVLLDEPDTHLNPQWSWEYAEMLIEAFGNEQSRRSNVLMATHDPVMISGLTKEQVWLAHPPSGSTSMFTHPLRNPRGQGIANLLCSSEFFGLPSSLDKQSQKLLDERLRLSIKPELTDADKERLRELNRQLEILTPGVSERDPAYVEFLRQRHGRNGS